MARIGFIGLGNMGGPMLGNLLRAGHEAAAFDLSAAALDAAVAAGATRATAAPEVLAGTEAVITVLPAGPHVRSVYLGEAGLLAAAKPGTLFIDCSTIDVATARDVHAAADTAGVDFVDAPMSGGVAGAEGARLTFMVGGTEAAFARARPFLEAMGKTIVHAGGAGTGQAAKICNNMILGVSMIAVSEAFALADALGLERQKLFDIASQASGQCWSLTSYCPVPGPVPSSPANRGYRPGFTAAMMLKDLRLAQEAAIAAGVATPLGAEAAALYGLFAASGEGQTDFSGIFRMVSGRPGG
ncbi:MAG: 3-hydroxyisobutyrate dehydrogenase [Alphaproteobacteria bacterium]|nr:MAG: 3-hydroxyisobutyrate dehydrogenase [Alphaproteobacteria bacterium]